MPAPPGDEAAPESVARADRVDHLDRRDRHPVVARAGHHDRTVPAQGEQDDLRTQVQQCPRGRDRRALRAPGEVLLGDLDHVGVAEHPAQAVR